MFHVASRRVYLREVNLREPRGSDTFQADVKNRKLKLTRVEEVGIPDNMLRDVLVNKGSSNGN